MFRLCQNVWRFTESFPLSPIFEPDSTVIDTSNEESFLENKYPKFNTLCEKMVGRPFAEVASNHTPKIGLPNISSEVRKAIRDTERKCISECSDSLNKSTLSAAYCTDTSLSKMERLRKVQYYEPPDQSRPKKNAVPFNPMNVPISMNLIEE